MSETPQETLTTYLHRGYIKGTLGPGEVREAIRAVLAQLEQARIDRDEAISQCVSIGRESKKLEAEVERLERARLRSADWLTFEKMEAESDALRSTVHDLSVQLEESGKEERALRAEGLAIADGQIADRERLEGLLRRIVHGIDKWNAGVEPIIGRPVDYKWLALEEARDVLAPGG
jgi:hypothetical protein